MVWRIRKGLLSQQGRGTKRGVSGGGKGVGKKNPVVREVEHMNKVLEEKRYLITKFLGTQGWVGGKGS